MKRVEVSPLLLRWARERAGLAPEGLLARFPRLAAWENGEEHPTLHQLEAFAAAVSVPIGYLFLPAPPEERLPIPDFRTIAGRGVARPSPDLLDTIHACQERQAWYREFALATQAERAAFVGSATPDDPPAETARRMRELFGFDRAARQRCGDWEEALRFTTSQAEAAGVLVMVSGVVGSNTHRPLDPEEFRGFALADPLAPLVFVNGNDARAARMFTLIHELAHLWLGTSALSDMGTAPLRNQRREETWCNRVAAEYLVPPEELAREYKPDEPLKEALKRLGRIFKVSSLVILRRLLDTGRLDREAFDRAWAVETARFARTNSGGGDFYNTTRSRVSLRFARALVTSTLEGRTLYRDAFRMLGVRKTETFHAFARKVGVAL